MDRPPAAAVTAIAQIGAVPLMLRVITEVTGLRLSLIAHVTPDRWTCCAVNDLQFGLAVGGELDVATTLCSEVRDTRAPIVISHASQDPAYCGHRTPKMYGFESYISVPIFLPDGEYFGNVCALDAVPIDLSRPQTLGMLQLFAELVGLQLAAEEQHERTSRALGDASRTGDLREQFIAVLAHDLRTPLQSLMLGVQLLGSEALPDWTSPVLARMHRSADRMNRLVDDVTDFARGRLGTGIPVQSSEIPDVLGMLQHVAAELAVAHPDRTIEIVVSGSGSMSGDQVRIGQLVQNLLGNALLHSPADTNVNVELALQRDQLLIVVTNGGPAIPDVVRARMFEPYQRGHDVKPGGLGLGLFIASEIVRSHGGTIDVTSIPGETTVRCTLPR